MCSVFSKTVFKNKEPNMFLLFSENCFSSLNLVFSIFYLLVVNGFLKKNLVLHRKKIKKKKKG